MSKGLYGIYSAVHCKCKIVTVRSIYKYIKLKCFCKILRVIVELKVAINFQLFSEKMRSVIGRGYYDQSRNEDLELPMVDLITIMKATDNFSSENKLGEGGFGPVYKVMCRTMLTDEKLSLKGISHEL